jgi:hypothetical protein
MEICPDAAVVYFYLDPSISIKEEKQTYSSYYINSKLSSKRWECSLAVCVTIEALSVPEHVTQAVAHV